MENKKPAKDTQARAYSLCLHNIKETGFDHGKIKEILNGIPSLQYACLSDEIGQESQRLHTHIYFYAKSPIRFSTIRNKFDGADLHIEPSMGNAVQNRDYVFKLGKWKGDPKADQCLPDTQEEWGTLPKQGHRTDLEEIYELIKTGLTNSEILEQIGDTAIKHIDKLDKLRRTYLVDNFKGQRRLDLKVHYITGQTGAGKSRDILDTYGDENVYRVTDYQHPFDSYQCERVFVFEEYRSSLRIQDMLNYLDVYPVTLPARYSPKTGCYNTVFVVSNWTFEQQYAELQKDPDQKSTYEAWKRRFNGIVKVYHSPGQYTQYDTLEEYLTRDKNFHPVEGPTPFD